MRIAIFSALDFERAFFDAANRSFHHDLAYYRERLHEETARMAAGFQAVCAFIADELDEATLSTLAAGGARLIALRSAGYNNVDLAAATKVGQTVLRVPAYSPQPVAEHAVARIVKPQPQGCRRAVRVEKIQSGRRKRTRCDGLSRASPMRAPVRRPSRGRVAEPVASHCP